MSLRTWFLGYVSSPSAEEEQDNFWQQRCASFAVNGQESGLLGLWAEIVSTYVYNQNYF